MVEKHNFVFEKEYWEIEGKENPIDAICKGFSVEDFKNKKESLIFHLEPEFNKDQTFLDLGCGIGRVARWVAPNIKEYHGVDISSTMIENAKEYNKDFDNVNFHQVSSCDLKLFEDNKFDVILSELVFIHLTPEEQKKYLVEINRVLKKDGTLLIEIPKEEYYINGFSIDEIKLNLPNFEWAFKKSNNIYTYQIKAKKRTDKSIPLNENILVLNFNNSQEYLGGSELVTERLANVFKTKVISAKTSAQLMGYEYNTYYKYSIIDRCIIFDKYLEQYEKINKANVIIRNSCCGAFYESKTPMITLYQEPSSLINEFMLSQNITGMDFDFSYLYPLLQRECSKNSFNVANSNFMKHYMDKEGIKCDKVIPLGVNLDLFTPIDIPKPENYKDKKVGIWVGKHHPLKWGFMPELIKNNPDIHWICVFFGGSVKIPRKLKNFEVYENLTQEEMVGLYNIADFCISTSPVESFGFVPLEAMACGKPVIAYKTGFLWDVEDFQGGIVVDTYKLESYQEALNNLFKKEWTPREEAKKWDIKKWEDSIKGVVKDLQ